jgi:hypothetical protein
MRVVNKSTVYDILDDRSGTITQANVSQQVAARNSDRCYLMIHNPGFGELWFNFTNAAVIGGAGSFNIPSGAWFFMEGSFCTAEPINVIADTAGYPFTVKENHPQTGDV